jgi:hypothetical protein
MKKRWEFQFSSSMEAQFGLVNHHAFRRTKITQVPTTVIVGTYCCDRLLTRQFCKLQRKRVPYLSFRGPHVGPRVGPRLVRMQGTVCAGFGTGPTIAPPSSSRPHLNAALSLVLLPSLRRRLLFLATPVLRQSGKRVVTSFLAAIFPIIFRPFFRYV